MENKILLNSVNQRQVNRIADALTPKARLMVDQGSRLTDIVETLVADTLLIFTGVLDPADFKDKE